ATRLYRSDKKAFAFMMLALMVMAGLEGLPGAEDIEDVIDAIGQNLGYATNSKKALRRLATSLLGPDMADIMLHGASAVPGFPLDVSMRMGMHNLIPGSSFFKTSEPDKTKEIVEALGPAASIADRLVLRGDARAALPKAIQDVVKAADMTLTGMYRDYRGRKIMETTNTDAFFKAIGFQPASVARRSRLEYIAKQDIDLQKVMEDSIATKWAQGVFERDSDKVSEARQMMRDWNETNPELPVRINPQQIMRRVREMRKTREERFTKQAAPEIRHQIREGMAAR
ncbi:MAG: PLxRFG domain-containing protein, partial [Betaproteobacteria bacterium]